MRLFVHQVRQPAVAGAFYPRLKQTLSSEVAGLLAGARGRAAGLLAAPKALIVPHAGYIYSGQIAALAYAQLESVRETVRRVVLLGPVHRVPVRGLALPGVSAFATPLGEIEIDQAAVASVSHLHQVVVSSPAHALEHSLEVQLPFLQATLDEFKLVPLAVGDVSAADVAEVLEALWGGPETLIVISSDLSHFLSYRAAQTVDQETTRNILALDGPLTHEQACGGTPINGLLLAASHHKLQPQLLGQCNSGDTAGDRQRVVGYAAFTFTPDDQHAIQ
jgi:MEMO1 family protein